AFFADKSVPTAFGQNQEQHCAGADLSAKTLVQTIHFREIHRLFRGQVPRPLGRIKDALAA
ncbi:hypothetical protein A3SM_02110, partial [Pseudomonas syringae pv. actinidiae ICMP 18886]|uniref:hypothetical protein n=1 Tax=Pseudomonas syringae TaxID=317 RepID=UPI0003570620